MIKIRIGGWAGQGTVLAGVVLGEALALGQGYDVVQTRSYSAAVRSGISFSDVIADKETVDELTIDIPDYMIILYQKTLDAWIPLVEECGCLIIDSTQIREIPKTKKLISIPASEIANDLGNTKAANMVLLGALSKILPELNYSALKDAVIRVVPERYEENNINALEAGYDFAVEL